MTITLGAIAEHINAELHGDRDCEIRSVAALDSAGADAISFLSNRRYVGQLKNTRAAAVILAREHLADCPVQSLVVDNPYLGYALTARLLYPEQRPDKGVHPSASVHETAIIEPTAGIAAHAVIEAGARIGPGVYIGPGSVVGRNAIIDADSRLVARVTICDSVRIGARALLHPGVVVGSDGFGLAEDKDGSWVKIPQIGTVIVHEDVEIGANTTVDRGAITDTVIGRGVKIDNQVQIGHNVIIGEYTAIAGCTGIAGSAVIGKRCRIGGACGISGHLQIADDVILTAMSAVNNSIPEAGIYSSPLSITDNRTWRKNVARFHKLDESFRRIREEIKQIKNES